MINDTPYKHIFLVDPISLIDFEFVPDDKIELVKSNVESQLVIITRVISKMISDELNEFPLELLKNYNNDRDLDEFISRLSNFYDKLKDFLYKYSITEDEYEFIDENKIGEYFNYFLEESTIICYNYCDLEVYRYGKKLDIDLDDICVSEATIDAIDDILSKFELCNIYILQLDIWLPKIPINTYYIDDIGGDE